MAVGDKKPVVMEADRAVPGGIATLGTDGKLSSEQIPDLEALGAIEYINSLPFTRKNLLDNWYFGNPVDQRGGYVVPPGIPYWTAMVDGTNPGSTDKYYKATVNTTRSDLFEFVMEGVTFYVPNYHVVRGYVGPCYGIDRWRIGANMVLLIEGDEIVLKNTGTSFGVMHQFTCENNMLGGQCCTGSALINDQLLSFSGEVAKNPSTDTYVGASEQIDAGYIEYWSRADKKEVWHFIVNAGKEMRIKAVKLELGTTQTLARQDENGNWVLIDPPPDKNTELLKCCMSTADLGDTYANNKMTPAAINGVNKAGDMMTGALSFNHRAYISDATDEQNWNACFFQTQGLNSGAGFTRLVLFGPEYWGQATIVAQRFDGNGAFLGDCIILHTGNKPSGSYTGNGDATPRTIETGGIGNFCILKVHGYGISIVTMQGAYKMGSTYNGWTDGAIFGNGVLTLTTTDPYLNPSGVSVEYQVL